MCICPRYSYVHTESAQYIDSAPSLLRLDSLRPTREKIKKKCVCACEREGKSRECVKKFETFFLFDFFCFEPADSTQWDGPLLPEAFWFSYLIKKKGRLILRGWTNRLSSDRNSLVRVICDGTTNCAFSACKTDTFSHLSKMPILFE